MLAQQNINQDLQANIFYLTGEMNYLSSAIIKGAQGKNIMIEWNPIKSEAALNGRSDEIKSQNEQDELTDIEELSSEVLSEQQVINEVTNKDTQSTDIGGEPVNTGVDNITNQTSKAEDSEIVTHSSNNVVDDTVGRLNDNIATYRAESTVNDEVSKTIPATNEDNNLQKNIKTYYGISTIEAYKFQLGIGGKIQRNGKWVSASASEIQQYFIPSEENIKKYKYQFLNLASPAGISEADAKAYLSDKGILKGKEAIFIEAAKKNNVNEIYLMAHACLETGNGTSKLATGVNYKGTVVYNMFGINAVDSDPIGQGAAYAYKMGWTTPEKAILGGTEFISKQYINNYPYNQDTLYEMRWNPASPGRHQYATDIAWATKQAERMEKIYATFTNATVTFDIPVYRK